jgi:hypothetical protein
MSSAYPGYEENHTKILYAYTSVNFKVVAREEK